MGRRTTGDGIPRPDDDVSRRRRPPFAVVGTAACVALAAGGVLIGWAAHGSAMAGRAAGAKGTSLSAPATPAPDPQRIAALKIARAEGLTNQPGYTLVARLTGSFPGYSRPGGRVKVQIPATWQTIPSMLPVIGEAPGGWLHVRLAQRPDQSTAWIRQSDAIMMTTPYRIVVNLETTHLQLYKLDQLVMNVPVGVGAPATPTPLGHYFVAFIEPSLGPGYGPFILVTSAHSQAIASWEGTGDAIVAIHGPLGADAEIGTKGAHISNGCVRMHDSDLARLEDVPPGTPIDIID